MFIDGQCHPAAKRLDMISAMLLEVRFTDAQESYFQGAKL